MEEKKKIYPPDSSFWQLFQGFQKDLAPEYIEQNLSDFCLYHDIGASTGEISESHKYSKRAI